MFIKEGWCYMFILSYDSSKQRQLPMFSFVALPSLETIHFMLILGKLLLRTGSPDVLLKYVYRA